MSEALVVQGHGELSTETSAPLIDEVLAHYGFVQQVMNKVMKEDTHYGPSFKGDTKKNLLKPGADALSVAFKFATEFVIDERNYEGGHREYRVTANIKAGNGAFIAQGEGTCTTLESKYRWRNAKRKCPECSQETVNKSKQDPGYYCWKKEGVSNGCGAKFTDDDDPRIVNQVVGKIENADPADNYNTCLKIGKKRALVDGIIAATGASNLFTQDAEEFATEPAATPKPAAQPAVAVPAPAKPQPQPAASPLGSGGVSTPAAQLNADAQDLLTLLKEAHSEEEQDKTWAIIQNSGPWDSPTMAAFLRTRRERKAELMLKKGA